MLVSARIYCEIHGLSRYAAAVRVHRGQLRAVRSHGRLYVWLQDVPKPPNRYVTKHGLGLLAVRDAKGRLRRVTLAEREAFAHERGGCGCDTCYALSLPAERENPAELQRQGVELDDSDEPEGRSGRERVL